MTDKELKYWAFLSGSGLDNTGTRPDEQGVNRLCWSNWLQEALRSYAIPAEFVGQINGRGELVPERIEPIFQDNEESPENASLSTEVRQGLEQSKCLVVICSPRSAKSQHVNEVVRYFKQLGRSHYILPVIIAGEPNASEGHKPGMTAADECFVPALRHPVRPDGSLDAGRQPGKYIVVDARHGVDKREILADDHRNAEADLESAKIQLIALLIGVAFNGLWWREQKRHFIDLAAAQHQAREARQRVEEVQRQLQEAQRQTREAQNQVLEAQNLPRDVHGQIQEAQNKAEAAQNQARELQQQLQDFQSKARETQSQLEEARGRVSAVENKFAEAQNQAREARQQAEEIQLQLQEAKNQVSAAPAENPEARQRAEEAQRQVVELQSLAAEAQAQVKEARAQAEEAHHQILNARREAEEARQQLQAAKDQVPAVTGQTEAAQREIEEARRQVQEVQGHAKKAEAEAREARQQAEQAQHEAKEARRQILEVQDRAAKAQVQEVKVDQAQGEIETAQGQLRQARRMTRMLALVTLIALLAAGIAWWQRKTASLNHPKPMVDDAKEADLAQGKLDKEQIRSALQAFGAVQPGEDRRQALDGLAARIPTEEIAGAMQSSAMIADEQQRSYFQLAMLDKWAKADAAAALGWVRQLPEATFQQRALEQIVPALAASNPTNTLAWLNDFKPTPGAGSFALLFQHWATNDPVQAIQARMQMPDHDADDTMLGEIMAAWVDAKPEAALAWVNAQPDSEVKNKAVEACVWGLSKTDFVKALALTAALPEGTWRSTVIAGLFNDWAARDLEAATTAGRQLPEGMAKTKALECILAQRIVKDPASAAGEVTNLPAGDFRQNAIAGLSSHWADTNTAAALSWAQSLPDSTEQTVAINQVVANWAIKDPQAAIDYANQHPELSSEAMGQIAQACSPSTLTAATNWVATLTDGEKKDKVLLALATTWSQADAKGMAAYALGLPAGEVQTQYLTAACHQLAVRDLPGTVELLKPLADDALRQGLLEQAGRACDLPHIDQAAKYIAAMPAGDDQKAVIKGMLANWAPADPEAAVNWLGTFPETNQPTEQVQAIITTWSQTAPAAAAKWLANLPAGTNSESAASAFLEGAGAKYPEFAAQWTQSIPDETRRQKYQVQVARLWKEANPEAAMKWIDSLNLPDELKQSLKAPAP